VRNKFDLHKDGHLRFYDDEHSTKANDAILLRDVVSIKVGRDVDATVPEHLMQDFLLYLETCTEKTVIMCGDSIDDAKAWQLALEQSRVLQTQWSLGATAQVYPAPAGMTGCYQYPYNYPGQVVYGSTPPYVIQNPNGTSTVVITREPDRRMMGSDMAMGMMAGAALGTMMWTPLLWW